MQAGVFEQKVGGLDAYFRHACDDGIKLLQFMGVHALMNDQVVKENLVKKIQARLLCLLDASHK